MKNPEHSHTQILTYNERYANHIKQNPNKYSKISIVLNNAQGLPKKIPYNQKLIKETTPTFSVISELKMRSAEAESLNEIFNNYASYAQTPDTRLPRHPTGLLD